MSRIAYVCPRTKAPLVASPEGLRRPDGRTYGYVCADHPDFLELAAAGAGQKASLAMYDTAAASEVYRNFLDWLFATFGVDEAAFRRDLAARLAPPAGGAVLITGCGLGDDIGAILDRVGPAGEVHAQDLSPAMIQAAERRLAQSDPARAGQVSFSAGDAAALPYADEVFDAAFHFGGINLFDDIGLGIAEMNRVVKPGGRVLFGDEGVGPWLKDTDFGRMVTTNNRLWALQPPLDRLPATAANVSVSWILGNCFWLIGFQVSDHLPAIDPHVAHKGWRGGSMWTRHHGQLEAVTAETRERVIAAAASAGLSVHDWLEQALAQAATRDLPRPEK